jgi:hypothetical protein
VRSYWILEGKKVKPASLEEWAQFLSQTEKRRLGHDRLTSKVLVSTVFLGLNHRFIDGGPPLVFETMIFGGPLDGEQYQYSEFDEAMQGHQKVVLRAERAIWQRMRKRRGPYPIRIRSVL